MAFAARLPDQGPLPQTSPRLRPLRALRLSRIARPPRAQRPPRLTRRLPRRLGQLYIGLALYGISDAMLVLAALGLDPWDVFHQGLSRTFGLGIGTWSIIVGGAVLLLWIPLRQRPGFGTLSNVVAIGSVMNVVLAHVSAPHAMALRIGVLVAAVALNGVATGCYIGAGLGPGPRDGLMTGLAARGHSIRVVRTLIELTVLIIGFVMGGTVGVGTVVYALCIGPLVHVFIPMLRVRLPARAVAAPERAAV